MPMLVLLPFIVLLIISFVVLLFGRIRYRLGTIWIISAVIVLLTWAVVMVLRMNLPGAFVIDHWLPGGISTDALRFELTPSLWFLVVVWMALLANIIFTDAAGLEDRYSNLILSGSLMVAAVTLLALTSSSLLTFLITWSMIDLVEFAILTQLIADAEMMRKTVVSFAFRLTGTLLVIAALAISKQLSQPMLLSSANGTVYTLLIIAVGFRLGVQPLHLPFSQSELIRRTLGTILRFASPIAAFALLVQLPAAQSMNGALILASVLATLAALYGAAMWATSPTDLAGRQYWALSLSGVAMLATLKGQSSVALACAAILAVTGGFIFVQSARDRRHTLLFVILILGMLGLPFTPFSGLWGFDIGAAWSFARLVQLVVFTLLIFGTYMHYEKKPLAQREGENWLSFFATAGAIILVLTPWLTLIWSRDLLVLKPGWWYALVLLGLLGLGFAFRTYFMNRLNKSDRAIQFVRDVAVFGARSLRNFFRFNWLFSMFAWIYHQLQVLIQFLEGVLEGEGGFLWALVFLALLASVLASAGK